MIVYDIICDQEHHFESWFRNSGAVEKLIKAKQVACPTCGSTKVQKALMAPRIGKSKGELVPAPAKAPPSGDVAAAMEKAAQALAELRQTIEKNFDNVGGRFPEEARRIHYGEAEKRGIYGDASKEDAQALLEEGIEVYAVPWSRKKNS